MSKYEKFRVRRSMKARIRKVVEREGGTIADFVLRALNHDWEVSRHNIGYRETRSRPSDPWVFLWFPVEDWRAEKIRSRAEVFDMRPTYYLRMVLQAELSVAERMA